MTKLLIEIVPTPKWFTVEMFDPVKNIRRKLYNTNVKKENPSIDDLSLCNNKAQEYKNWIIAWKQILDKKVPFIEWLKEKSSLSEEDINSVETNDYFDNITDNQEFISNLFEEQTYSSNIEEIIAKEYNSLDKLKWTISMMRVSYKVNNILNPEFEIIPKALKEELWKKGLTLILENGEAISNLNNELSKVVKEEIIEQTLKHRKLSFFGKVLLKLFETPEETQLKNSIMEWFQSWKLPKDSKEKKLFLKTLSKAKVWKYKNKLLNVEEYLNFMDFASKKYFWISMDDKILEEIKFENILESNSECYINTDFQVSVNLNNVEFVMTYLQNLMHEYSHALTYKFMQKEGFEYMDSFSWPLKKIASLIKEWIAEDFAHYVFMNIAEENKDRFWINHWYDFAAEVRLYERLKMAELRDLNFANLESDLANSVKQSIQKDRENTHIYAKGYIMVKVIREKLWIEQFRKVWLTTLMKVAFWKMTLTELYKKFKIKTP